MKQQRTVLIVDDCQSDRETYQQYLLAPEFHYTVLAASSATTGLELSQFADVILLESRGGSPEEPAAHWDGLAFLQELQLRDTAPPVIMLTRHGNETIAVQALKAGAIDYLVKQQTTPEMVELAVQRAIEQTDLRHQLQQSQRLMQQVAETTPGILYVYDLVENRNIYVNHRVADLLGYTATQIQDMGGEWLSRLMHPDDAVRLPERFTKFQVAADDEVLEWEYRLHHANGEWRWFLAREVVFQRCSPPGETDSDGTVRQILGTAQDITARKRAEASLQRSERYYRDLADALPVIVWICDPQGQLEYVNQRLFDYTGLTRAQVQGWGWLAAVHTDDVQRLQQHWQEAMATNLPYQLEYRLWHTVDRAYRWHLIHCIPVKDPHGQIVKWFGTCADIHDRKQLEAERSELLQREHAAREQAEQASRTKDEFLAIVSHELRSPLNSMLGWAKLLRTRNLNPDTMTRALETIERNAQAQAQLIDDLLDISRMIRGNLRLNLMPVNLVAVIDAVLDVVRPTAEAKQIQLTFAADHHLPYFVSGDFQRLQQVVGNIISNAIKFTPAGGHVVVHIESVAPEAMAGWGVTPTAALQRSFAEVSVSDTGKGIAPEFLPYVFERFRQAESTSTRSHDGLGLGLAIVRHLVELHGGSVAAASPGENQGSTFTIRLPMLQEERQEPQDLEERSSPSMPAPLSGLKLLVVDDEPDTREFLVFTLQDFGATVEAAASVADALAALDRMTPDLVLSDIAMPGEDGYSFIKHLRSRSTTLPAIALTAYARNEDRDEAIAAGFQRHLAKPVEPTALIEAIVDVMGQLKAKG